MFSIDVLVALIAFIFVFIAAAQLNEYSVEKISLLEKRNEMQRLSQSSMSSLIETAGIPPDWHTLPEDSFNVSHVHALGLVASPLHGYPLLSEQKISVLDSLDASKYETYKTILGLHGYEFELDIRVWDGSSYSSLYSVGRSPASYSSSVIRTDRFALVNGTWSNIILMVWEDCGKARC